MKKAVLHFSYSVPVRVSDIEFVVDVARAVTLRVPVVAERVDVFVSVFEEEFLGIKILTGFVERAEMVVFNGVLDVMVRVVRAVEFFVLDTVFSPRTADSALVKQNKHA